MDSGILRFYCGTVCQGYFADNLFQFPRFKELLARLDYEVKKRYFCLVTGDIGAGKSTAIRFMAKGILLKRRSELDAREQLILES